MNNRTKRLSIWAAIVALILMVPLVAMQFSTQVNWSPSDFIAMGTMIFAAGLLIDLAIRKMGKYRVAAVIAIVILFLWLWAELAVGLFT